MERQRQEQQRQLELARREREAERTQIAETLTLMLPVSHQYATRHYTRLVAIARNLVDAVMKYRQKPNDDDAQEGLYYFVRLFQRLRILTRSEGGFYFKDRNGEEIVVAALRAYNKAMFENHKEANLAISAVLDAVSDRPDLTLPRTEVSAGLSSRTQLRDEQTVQLLVRRRREARAGCRASRFHFGRPPDAGQLNFSNATYLPPVVTNVAPPAGLEPSVQGYSIGSWTIMGGSGNFERGGSLKVITTHLKPGYYWKNGMPYTGNAVLTEYFRTMELPDRSQWIRLTQIVDDPDYLTQPWIVNYQFKRLPDGSKWNPTPCSVN